MAVDGFREPLEQRSKLADFEGERIGYRAGLIERVLDLCLQRSQPPTQLCELAGDVGRGAGQVGELRTDHGAQSKTYRNEIINRQRRQRDARQRCCLRATEPEIKAADGAGGARDDQHADCNKNGSKPHGSLARIVEGQPPTRRCAHASHQDRLV
jgi:hypothetical protein